MTAWDEPIESGPQDRETTGLEEFLEELMALEGVLMAALLDRSGRIMRSEGFDPGVVEDVAVLAASLHASGARLGEAAGDKGFPRILIQTSDRSVLISPLPVRAGIPLVLLVVTTKMGLEDLGPRLEDISGVLLEEAVGLNAVDDPEALEAALLESLEGLFPRKEGP